MQQQDDKFGYTVECLYWEIQKVRGLSGYSDKETDSIVKELQSAIKVLREGQAYLRKDKPIGIRFYRDL